MSLLDAYKQKLAIQIEEHKAHLEILKERAKQVAAESKALGHRELAQADKHFDHVKARFQELKGAGSHAFADLKTGMQNALADLKSSTTKAAKHFGSHPPSPRRAHRRHRAKLMGHVKHAVQVKAAVKRKVIKKAKQVKRVAKIKAHTVVKKLKAKKAALARKR